MLRSWTLIRPWPLLASHTFHTLPPRCERSRKVWPDLAATMPLAGYEEGNFRNQLAARLSSGTMRPNILMARAQPQKRCGHPAGRSDADAKEEKNVSITKPRSALLSIMTPYRCYPEVFYRFTRVPSSFLFQPLALVPIKGLPLGFFRPKFRFLIL